METKHVDVTYDVKSDQWTITPDKVGLKEAGVIVFHRHPSDARWKFKHINGVPTQWKQEAEDDGESYHVHDPHTEVPARYTYKVVVHVEDDDKDHEGPDKKDPLTDPPIIINEL